MKLKHRLDIKRAIRPVLLEFKDRPGLLADYLKIICYYYLAESRENTLRRMLVGQSVTRYERDIKFGLEKPDPYHYGPGIKAPKCFLRLPKCKVNIWNSDLIIQNYEKPVISL